MSVETIQHTNTQESVNTGFSANELDSLFGTDLEFLETSGSLSIFHYNHETGFSGLAHTLIGDEDGGFHSESAAKALGLNHPSRLDKTIVDRITQPSNSADRREYKEREFEPFAARVIVGGVRKMRESPVQHNATRAETRNSMFPNEYDATAVVRTVNIAYSSLDRSQDKVSVTKNGVKVLVNSSGLAPMIDGKTMMKVRMLLDYDTGKVITANPIVDRHGYMNLDTEEARALLLT